MKRTRFFISIKYREVVGMKSRAWRCHLSFTHNSKEQAPGLFNPGTAHLSSSRSRGLGNFSPMAHPLILICNNPTKMAIQIGEISDCTRLSITTSEHYLCDTQS